MSKTLPTDRQATLRVVPMPADTNAAGNIFGGWLMSQVDVAGSIVAIRRARGAVTTVAVNAFRFIKPVYVGDTLTVRGRVRSRQPEGDATRVTVEVWCETRDGEKAVVGTASGLEPL